MSRYIDADTVYKWLRSGCAYVIWEEPTIDIVLCKECKWWLDNLNEDNTYEDYVECPFDGTRRIPKPDDFCSYGERKESE